MDPYIGEIRPVGFLFAPHGWALCQGQILAINQNQALFSLLGTTYGGDGRTTFALPDLRGRIALSSGQGPGLSDYSLGQVAGTENVTLLATQMPAHDHAVNASTLPATTLSPVGAIPARGVRTVYGPTTGAILAADSVGNAGGSQPHVNTQPYLVLNYIIALVGIFPPR